MYTKIVFSVIYLFSQPYINKENIIWLHKYIMVTYFHENDIFEEENLKILGRSIATELCFFFKTIVCLPLLLPLHTSHPQP